MSPPRRRRPRQATICQIRSTTTSLDSRNHLLHLLHGKFPIQGRCYKSTARNLNMSNQAGSKSQEAPVKCVGPGYRDEEQKPSATVSTAVPFENVHVLSQTPQLIALLTYVHIPTQRAGEIWGARVAIAPVDSDFIGQHDSRQKDGQGRLHLLLQPHYPTPCRGGPESLANSRAYSHHTGWSRVRWPNVPGEDLRRLYYESWRGNGTRATRLLSLGEDWENSHSKGRGDIDAKAVLR